jgi:hypothetical protein
MNSNLSSTANNVLRIRQLEQNFLFYGAFVILFPGLFLNVLNIIIFKRRAFSRSVKFFYIWQSIIDIFSIAHCLLILFPSSFNQDLAIQSDFMCKYLNIALRYFANASHWYQGMITFDRFFFTLFNSKYKSLNRTKYLWSCVLFILILIFFTSMINLLMQQTQTITIVNNATVIQRQCQAPRSIGLFVNLSGLVMRAVIPLSFMLTFNLILIYKLMLHKSKLNSLKKKDIQFAFSIVILNFVFMLLNTPRTFSQIYDYSPTIVTDEDRALVRFLLRSGLYIMYIYPSYSFVLYVIFNRIFRRQINKIRNHISQNASFSNIASRFI